MGWVDLWVGSGRVGSSKFDLFVGRVGSKSSGSRLGRVKLSVDQVGSGPGPLGLLGSLLKYLNFN